MGDLSASDYIRWQLMVSQLAGETLALPPARPGRIHRDPRDDDPGDAGLAVLKSATPGRKLVLAAKKESTA